MNKRLSIFFLLLFPVIAFSQQRPQRELLVYQDSLKSLGKRMIDNEDDLQRKTANYTFIKTLTGALKVAGSFNFKFDSVKTISITNAPDSKFRIFSWHVMNEDGSYRFYGTIQMNTGNGTLLLHPLVDATPFIASPQDTVITNTQWYGAQYYSIIPVSGANPYYVLLGWKGNNVKTTKKVIEVLSFKNGKPVFGMPVLMDKGKALSRVVFEYSRQVSMMLKYLPEQQTIVFDNLVAPAKNMTAKEFYGPDLTYNAYRLKGGVWQFQENVDLRNVTGSDDELIDPKKQARDDRAAAGASHP